MHRKDFSGQLAHSLVVEFLLLLSIEVDSYGVGFLCIENMPGLQKDEEF